jgi:hypothetical protein
MAAKGKTKKKQSDRQVVRKSHQIIAKLRNSDDRREFERRLRTKCEEVSLSMPPSLAHGRGESVTLVCKNRDKAIFLLDFAEETLAEMPD